jgi:hypothetical protein
LAIRYRQLADPSRVLQQAGGQEPPCLGSGARKTLTAGASGTIRDKAKPGVPRVNGGLADVLDGRRNLGGRGPGDGSKGCTQNGVADSLARANRVEW